MSHPITEPATQSRHHVEILISGPAGSGKSVLLSLIGRMLKKRGFPVRCRDDGFMQEVTLLPQHLPDGVSETFEPDPEGTVIIETATNRPGSELGEPENAAQKQKAELLSALSLSAADGRGRIEFYRAVMRAWRDGLLTDREADGIGRILIALERNG